MTLIAYNYTFMVAGLVLGAFFPFVSLVWSSLLFRSSMPVAGNCSWAIAAACHPPADDTDAAVLPVKWGDVGKNAGVAGNMWTAVGHCCFTSKPETEIRELQPEKYYE